MSHFIILLNPRACFIKKKNSNIVFGLDLKREIDEGRESEKTILLD